MPELPEIETVKLQLQKVLTGRTFEKITVYEKKTFRGKENLAEGKKIVKVRRIAKVLIVDLEEEVSVAFHFKMTGQLIYDKDDNPETYKDRIAGGHPTQDFTGPLPSKHTRVVFHLDRGTLYFNDQRKFGWVIADLTRKIDEMDFLQKLGPEPFDIDEKEFEGLVGKRKKPVKLVLMDQEIISGVGNIYANDALWEAKIAPRRLANTLRQQQYKDLYKAVLKVLGEGIKFGGATAADAKYIDLHGMGGHYQDHFRVYDQEGELCKRDDGGIIHKFSLGGRGTYFCPQCQK